MFSNFAMGKKVLPQSHHKDTIWLKIKLLKADIFKSMEENAQVLWSQVNVINKNKMHNILLNMRYFMSKNNFKNHKKSNSKIKGKLF